MVIYTRVNATEKDRANRPGKTEMNVGPHSILFVNSSRVRNLGLLGPIFLHISKIWAMGIPSLRDGGKPDRQHLFCRISLHQRFFIPPAAGFRMTETLPVSCHSERSEESLPLHCMLMPIPKTRFPTDRQHLF